MKVGWEVTQGDFKGPDIIIFLTYFVLHIGIPTIIVQTHTNVYIHAHTCEEPYMCITLWNYCKIVYDNLCELKNKDKKG